MQELYEADEAWVDDDPRPPRAARSTLTPELAQQTPAGGRLAAMREKATDNLKDFILLRGPLGAVRFSLGHATILKAIWRVWTQKRIARADDPGASISDIVEATGSDVKQVRNVVASLLKNHVIRSRVRYTGWRGARATYYPSDAGVQALALAEVLGPGHAVQVGRTAQAWASRSQTEPGTLFQHAALLRGGAVPAALDTEYPT